MASYKTLNGNGETEIETGSHTQIWILTALGCSLALAVR